MESGAPGAQPRDGRFDALYAEAASVLGYAGNTLRSVTERYREAHREVLGRLHQLMDDLESIERRTPEGRPRTPSNGAGASSPEQEAVRAEAAAADGRTAALRTEVERLSAVVAGHGSDLGRLELAIRGVENTWLFLERGDTSLVGDGAVPVAPADMQMRIVEAQEAERTRLAQEVHDGPAQALTNAIFQVEYIERLLEQDPRLARTELRYLRELLRRDLGDVRSFITQLRPPLLDQLGLEGAVRDTADTMAALSGATVEQDLAAPADALPDPAQTVVLRVLQEALQNIRKHAGARHVWVTTRLDEGQWILEVRDDGRGFDLAAAAAAGRRSFGLQFMRERAALVGARLEVRSHPGGGTVVWLAIPVGKESR